jgi:hypothetical protein
MSDNTEWQIVIANQNDGVQTALRKVLRDAVRSDTPPAAQLTLMQNKDENVTIWQVLSITDRLVASAQAATRRAQLTPNDAVKIYLTIVPMARVEIAQTVFRKDGWNGEVTTWSATLTLGGSRVDLPDLTEDGAKFLQALVQRL